MRRERFLDAAARRGVEAVGIRDRSGHRYFVDPRDRVIGRLLFLDGAYEHGILDRALEHIGFEPDQVIDVGANIGTVTIELLSRFPDAVGFAVEPDPGNGALLAQNLLANGLQSRVRILPEALSDADTLVEFELSDDNFGDHRVRVRHRSGEFSEEIRPTLSVPARRFDSLVRDGVVGLTDRTLVCIDAQGHEGHIFAGASKLLSHPVVVEYWPYGLRRAEGMDRFLAAIDGRSIIDLAHPAGEISIDRLRDLDLGTGIMDLLLMPS